MGSIPVGDSENLFSDFFMIRGIKLSFIKVRYILAGFKLVWQISP